MAGKEQQARFSEIATAVESRMTTLHNNSRFVNPRLTTIAGVLVITYYDSAKCKFFVEEVVQHDS